MMPDDRVQRREAVVQPRGSHAQRDDERGIHDAEALVEVGAVLLADRKARGCGNPVRYAAVKGIHVPDDRPQWKPEFQRGGSAAIGRNQAGRKRKGVRNVLAPCASRAQDRDPDFGFDHPAAALRFRLAEAGRRPARLYKARLLDRRADEVGKQRMGAEGPGFQLGVELHADEPRVVRNLHDFRQAAVRRHS